jgi:PAS domain S-box-containing protein
VLTGGQLEYRSQYRVLRADGTTCWIDAHGVTVQNGSKHMLGIGVDITDLKKIEDSLQQSEEMYLLLLNSTAEAIYGLDMDGNCTFCNPTGLRLLGYQRPEEVLGKNMHLLVHHSHPDGRPYPIETCAIYVAIRNGTESHIIDEVLWRPDGTSFPVEYWSYPMRKEGKVVGAVVTFLDSSARIQAEHALRQSEEKYRGLFENAPYGIFCATADGALLDVNPALRRMLGYDSKQELMEKNLNRDIYVDPAVRAAILSRLGPAGRVDEVEVEWKRKDKSIIHVRLNGRVILDEHRKPSHMEVIVQELS